MIDVQEIASKPGEAVRLMRRSEVLSRLTTEELRSLIESINMELNARENH